MVGLDIQPAVYIFQNNDITPIDSGCVTNVYPSTLRNVISEVSAWKHHNNHRYVDFTYIKGKGFLCMEWLYLSARHIMPLLSWHLAITPAKQLAEAEAKYLCSFTHL